MLKAVVLTGLLVVLTFLTSAPSAWAAEDTRTPGAVVIVTLDGAITPATADYAVRGMRRAADQGAPLVVLRLDTPGGLDTSMRSIIKAILGSPIPVATFVAPDGARAASAGTFILYASHIAAMAPATNVGAATPVAIGGGGEDGPKPVTERRWKSKDKDKDKDEEAGKSPASSRDAMRAKQINDAAAYIRSLAELRGRNAEWAERAVRDGVSIAASEALKLKVIDLVARDVPDLLKQLDGRSYTLQGVERKLQTAGAPLVEVEPDWRTRLLMVVTDPSVAVILMMIGIYGLFFEFMNPGLVFPGVLGAISLLVALYAFQLLPINYAGVALILLGLAFIVAEAFMPSFGVLGIGGLAALAIGMVILVDPEAPPGFSIPLSFIAGFAIVTAAGMFATAYLALRARRQPVVSGREDLSGAEGIVLGDFEGEGWARVRGEMWRVRSGAPLKQGERVRVVGMSGLTLTVEKL
jgi:membrane-bound serine protease (ClpP class)